MPPADYKPKRLGIEYPSPSRFQWRRILRRCRHVDTGFLTPCWIFIGYTDSDGYGECKYNGEKRFVHRIAYAWGKGKAPARRDMDHACHQRACCNPSHVFAVQPKINAGDHGEMPEQVNGKNFLDYLEKRGKLKGLPF